VLAISAQLAAVLVQLAAGSSVAGALLAPRAAAFIAAVRRRAAVRAPSRAAPRPRRSRLAAALQRNRSAALQPTAVKEQETAATTTA